MPAPHGQDLRDRVLAAYDRGKKTKEIADTFGVSPAWARGVKQVRREQQPDATIPELHDRLGKDRCSESAVGMALLRLGLGFKKRRSLPPNRIGLMWSKKEPRWPGGRCFSARYIAESPALRVSR